MIDLLLKYMWKTLALQNGRSPLNYKLIRHRFATCIFFHFFSSMLSLYKKMICGSTISHVDCLPNESLVLQNHDKNLFSTKGPFSTKRSVQHHFNLIKWYLTNLLQATQGHPFCRRITMPMHQTSFPALCFGSCGGCARLRGANSCDPTAPVVDR